MELANIKAIGSIGYTLSYLIKLNQVVWSGFITIQDVCQLEITQHGLSLVYNSSKK